MNRFVACMCLYPCVRDTYTLSIIVNGRCFSSEKRKRERCGDTDETAKRKNGSRRVLTEVVNAGNVRRGCVCHCEVVARRGLLGLRPSW